MNYHKIEACNLANGTGWRVILWLSGCSHHCPGCHNPETWDENSGAKFDTKAKDLLFDLLSKDYIKGITFTGGDPLHKNNRKEVIELCKQIKEKFQNKDIWLYTGYTFEEIKTPEILKDIDVLVDGPYMQEKRDITIPFRGSTNQRIIDVCETLNKKEIILKPVD